MKSGVEEIDLRQHYDQKHNAEESQKDTHGRSTYTPMPHVK